MRQCTDCKKSFRPTTKKGYRCPPCRRAWYRNWRIKRKALGLPVRGRTSPEWMKAYLESYYKRPSVRKRRAALMRKYINDPALRQRHKARWILNRAIASKKVERGNCAECGADKRSVPIEAHHHDYSKPLDVAWLCRACHRSKHAKAQGIEE